MSDDFEDYLKNQSLKEPSAELDDRVLGLFDNNTPEVKVFPWQKFTTYAVAAILFLAIGVTELMQRYTDGGNPSTVQTPANQNFTNGTSATVPTMKVSTSKSGDFSGEDLKRKLKTSAVPTSNR